MEHEAYLPCSQNPLLYPIMRQMNPVHTINRIRSRPRSQKFSFLLSPTEFLCSSYHPSVLHSHHLVKTVRIHCIIRTPFFRSPTHVLLLRVLPPFQWSTHNPQCNISHDHPQPTMQHPVGNILLWSIVTSCSPVTLIGKQTLQNKVHLPLSPSKWWVK
jgi:hypothetical protein